MSHTTIALASSSTGIPRRTLRDAIVRGDLKATKLGSATAAYIIRIADLERYLARRAEKLSDRADTVAS